jgi:hypothetical protein
MTNAQEVSMTTVMKRTLLVLAVLTLGWSVSANALPIRGRVVVVPRGRIYAPYVYDPFWGPYYRYGGYAYVVRPTADVRVEVVPKQTEVYVDGFFAGVAGDFDGVFQRLHTAPGGHAITLHLDGYRTVTENVYVRPDSTFKIHESMDRLAAGDVSAPPPAPTSRQR